MDGFLMNKVFPYLRFIIIWVLFHINKNKTLSYSLEFALIYEQLGLYFRAARIYHRIIQTHPEDPRGYYGIAILYDNKKRYHEALPWYKKSIQVNARFVPSWFFMASALYETGQKQKAIECYQKVTELDPEHFWAYNNAGSIYEELDRDMEALKYFRKALEIIPTQHKALFNIGVVLSKMGYEKKAQESYWESIRGYNKYPYSFLNLSLLYKKEQKLDRAIVVISEGIRCNPQASFLYYNRACFLAIAGNTDAAFLDVVRATQLNPSIYAYAEEDEDLKNVRNHHNFEALRNLIPKKGETDE